jgi:hypothetical protein
LSENGTLWASNGYNLFFSTDYGYHFQHFSAYAPVFWEKVFSRSRMLSRLLRSGFYAFSPFKDGSSLAVVKGRLLKMKSAGMDFRPTFILTRGTRPLNICVDPGERVFWGEYFNNPDRDKVNIYYSEDKGDHWEIIYSFPKGSIRHIHGIFHDSFRGGFWILTGDEGAECKICYTLDFKSIEVVAQGTQNCRAVSVIPYADGLVVPTDTPYESNFIQWFDIKSCKFYQLHPLPNSAFFSMKTADLCIISTAVEYSKTNLSPHSYLMASTDGKVWKELYKQRKDIWHLKYFQFGVFNLPVVCSNAKYIFAGGQALAGEDNFLLRWSVKDVLDDLSRSR